MSNFFFLIHSILLNKLTYSLTSYPPLSNLYPSKYVNDLNFFAHFCFAYIFSKKRRVSLLRFKIVATK